MLAITLVLVVQALEAIIASFAKQAEPLAHLLVPVALERMTRQVLAFLVRYHVKLALEQLQTVLLVL